MKIVKRFYRLLINDSLYKNSIYIMASIAVMSALGFFFWIINARIFTTEQVGIGTALISVLTLISGLSVMGLGNSLIRFLPTSKRKNKKINTSFAIVAIVSVAISLIYLIFIKTFSPKLIFIRENIWFLLLFIFFAVVTSLNTLSESIFIAYRVSRFVLIKNTILSIVKLAVPVALVAVGAYGIFMSVGIATATAFLYSLVLLILRFNYRPKLVIDRSIVKRMTAFSLGNHSAGLISGIPTTILPILIINLIGAEYSAYFYMAMMIASFLFIIPTGTSQSLFAEGSYSEKELKIHFIKAIKITFYIISPLIVLFFFLGNYVLLVFGKDYSNEGFTLLRILTASGIFYSINEVGGIILKIKYRIKLMIILSVINAVFILLLSVLLVQFTSLGIIGVGIGWIVANGITSLIYIFLIKRFLFS